MGLAVRDVEQILNIANMRVESLLSESRQQLVDNLRSAGVDL